VIATVSSGRAFHALARYLVRGRGDPVVDRVAWTASRNLASDDPERAAGVMRARVQARNARVEHPVYHVTIAFDPRDAVTPAVMRRAADRLLSDLGLAEHQVLMVAHADRAHPHVHLMINRVHPTTGRAWDRAFDYRRIETSLRAQEREFGLRAVVGRHAPGPVIAPSTAARPVRRPDELDDPDRHGLWPDRRTRGEAQRARRTAQAPLLDRARAHLPAFRASPDWATLTTTLAANGLHLERRGQGLVVSDGESVVQASRVARDCAMRALEQRFGEQFDAWRERERQAQPGRTDHPLEGTTGPTVLASTDREPTKPITTPASPVGGRPGAALDSDELARLERVARYVEGRFPDPNRFDPVGVRPIEEQSASARFAARRLGLYEEVLSAGVAVAAAREALSNARDGLRDETRAVREAAGAERALGDALTGAYRDPPAARAALDQAVRTVGADGAESMLRETPAVYGALRTNTTPERVLFVPVAREDDRAARAAAMLAADLVERTYRARERAPTPERLAGLARAAVQAESDAVRAETLLARLPQPDALARSVGRGVARLDDREFAGLQAALPPAQVGLAHTFRDATMQALVRESAGRVQQLRESLTERLGGEVTATSTTPVRRRVPAVAMHARAADAMLDGREVERALSPVPPQRARLDRVAERLTDPARGTPARGAGAVGEPSLAERSAGAPRGKEGGERARNVGVGRGAVVASPRERTAAADAGSRAVQQALQALTPDELQALVVALRLGVQLASQIAGAGLGGRSPVPDSLRRGISAALSGREAGREVER
jgi:hypothetical protein